MTPEEEWKRIDKQALSFMRKDAQTSHCPKHIWIETSVSKKFRGIESDNCIICGLNRRKLPNQYRYRYSKKAKHRQEDIDKRWEMYNEGIDLEKFDEDRSKILMNRYRK